MTLLMFTRESIHNSFVGDEDYDANCREIVENDCGPEKADEDLQCLEDTPEITWVREHAEDPEGGE
jgi:hypothetical protein